MKLLTYLLSVVVATAAPLPGYVNQVPVQLTRIGETIVGSGTVLNRNRTFTDARYVEKATSAAGILPVYSVSPSALEWENFTESIASFDGTLLTFKQNGEALIIAKYGGFNRKTSFPINARVFSSVDAGTNYVFTTNVVGSLSEHISTNIFWRLYQPSTKRKLFTVRTPETGYYFRNENCFISDVTGIECYPAGNNSGANMMNGCLISSQHMLSVAHIGSQLSQVVSFVHRTTGEIYTRTVIDYISIFPGGDMTVCLLDSALPAGIVPAKFLESYEQKLPTYFSDEPVATYLRRLPCITLNQTTVPAIHNMHVLGTVVGVTTFPDLPDWRWDVRGGDSGSPILTIVKGEIVVLGNFTSAGGGTCAIANAALIQTKMDELSNRNSKTTRSISYVSITEFPNY